jgi:uncharacterized membrane protein
MQGLFTSPPKPRDSQSQDPEEPVWRQRLDTTTKRAVVTTGVMISISFGQSFVHHGVIILNTMLVTLFLFIESRRYCYYEL